MLHRTQIQWAEGLPRSFAMPNPFVLTNKICLNQIQWTLLQNVAVAMTHLQ